MIENISEKIAIMIKEANPKETSSVEVMQYSLSILINFVLVLSASLLCGWITGYMKESFQAFYSFFIVRSVSGGYHMKTLLGCFFVSSAAFIIIPLIHLTRPEVIALTILTVIAFFFLSPSNTEINNIPPKYYPFLRILSVCVVCTNFYFLSSIFCLSFLLQGLLLIPGRR